MLSNRLESDVRCNSQGPLNTALSADLGATIFHALDDDFGDPAPVPVPVHSISGGDDLDEFERPAGAFPALDGDEGISAPSLEHAAVRVRASFQATPEVPSSFQSPAPPQFQSPVPQGPNYSAFAQPEVPEPEIVRQLREHQAEKIAQQDEESKRKRQETIARAEKEIDKLYEDYNSKKERTIRENQENKAEFLSSLADSLSTGTTWSRICELIDLENSQSKTVARA
ncbi:Clathrin light chain Short=CLC [Rhizoctonia solani AG-1 IB]|uniref:Clathrin light chain n=1 Tax=Thanatephorus cucumeris (strain AG1-IB / isolate 7/3/14) TaxID=1108050 RepID=M5CGC4_THACB|nr:Clathrin light chain Short=CLC [Rhizoctonia solani AG-1 IB]